MKSFEYDILKKYGSLSESRAGWSRELNLVSWNGREAKYDIRDWSPDGSKMGKGLSFTKEELKELLRLLESMDL